MDAISRTIAPPIREEICAYCVFVDFMIIENEPFVKSYVFIKMN